MTRLLFLNKFIILLLCLNQVYSNCYINHVNFEMNGNLTLHILIDGTDNNCERSLALGRTQIASIAWIIQRINYLNYLNGLVFGLRIYDTCSETEKRLNTILEMYLNNSKTCLDNQFHIPIVTSNQIAFETQQLQNILDIPTIQINEYYNHELLLDATIQFLVTMNFNKEIVLVTNSQKLEDLFNANAKEKWLCVRNTYRFSEIQHVDIIKSNILVVFGNKEEITSLLTNPPDNYLKIQWILVPLDEEAEYEVLPPNNSYIIRPIYADYYQTMIEYLKLTTSTILLNVAKPILQILFDIRQIIDTKCTSNNNLSDCIVKHYHNRNDQNNFTDNDILEFLKIEQLYNKFVYEIHEIFTIDENDYEHHNNFNNMLITKKICNYNIFNRTLHFDEPIPDNSNSTRKLCNLSQLKCLVYCKNFNKYRTNFTTPQKSTIGIKWRTEKAWIAAIISISSIGFCTTCAVLLFILFRLVKGDILEGNPTSSILLLLIILCMYAMVIPFSITLVNKPPTNEEDTEFNYILQDEDNNYYNIVEPTVNNVTINDDEKYNLTFIDFDENITEFISTTEESYYYENVTEFINDSSSTTTESYLEDDEDKIEYTNYSSLIHSLPYHALPFHSFPYQALRNENIIELQDEKLIIEYENLICTYTVFGISFLYAFAFSILLSRFIVVATIGNDGGFMSHVNGYIQSTLCFFMTLVQVGFNSDLWFIYNECDTIFNNNFILIIISYDIFLLILLIILSPFVIRSQRNYKEGIMGSVAVYIIGGIWLIWVMLYYYLNDREYRNILLICGMIATASVLLVCVFIPRTYLMMTGIARDRITNALPTLAHTQSTSILDINFRTNSQATYGCVNPMPISSILHNSGEVIPQTATLPIRQRVNYYSEEPDDVDGGMTEEHHNATNEENTYERYDTPPSPTKITRF